MRILGQPPEPLLRAVTSVFESAGSSGVSVPAALVIADDAGGRLDLLWSLSRSQRRRSVVVTGSDESLLDAVRLAVGGAAWLPCSSLAALEALEAAAGAGDVPGDGMSEADVLDLAACADRVSVVHLADAQFWHHQLGRGRMLSLLAELAGALGVLPAFVGWPALLVAGEVDWVEVAGAWRELADRRRQPLPDLLMFEAVGGREKSADICRGLVAGSGDDRFASASVPAPVRELPGGRMVGRWWLDEAPAPASAWLAWPQDLGGCASGRWLVSAAGRDELAVESATCDEVPAVAEASAVRVPGWVTDGLGSGTPAGILIARLAEAADRRGLPLWIPNLEQDGLHFVLGLPGTLWVDGSAVPE